MGGQCTKRRRSICKRVGTWSGNRRGGRIGGILVEEGDNTVVEMELLGEFGEELEGKDE
ncbi:hypothetical protein PanWU01x14_257780, partial [Parasponia andersonii]